MTSQSFRSAVIGAMVGGGGRGAARPFRSPVCAHDRVLSCAHERAHEPACSPRSSSRTSTTSPGPRGRSRYVAEALAAKVKRDRPARGDRRDGRHLDGRGVSGVRDVRDGRRMGARGPASDQGSRGRTNADGRLPAGPVVPDRPPPRRSRAATERFDALNEAGDTADRSATSPAAEVVVGPQSPSIAADRTIAAVPGVRPARPCDVEARRDLARRGA